MNLNDKADWCLSGGAVGADAVWGEHASATGHGVIHFSFGSHRSTVPENTIVRLTSEQLQNADEACRRANRTLGRTFPAKSAHVTNLLRRDWYQVEPAERCYAVSTLGLPLGPSLAHGTIVQGEVAGGTAWAVQMFIDRHDGAACECYLFDQVLAHWFRWTGDGWTCIYSPPKPTGVYAGIGRRELLPMGQLAIKVLMRDD